MKPSVEERSEKNSFWGLGELLLKAESSLIECWLIVRKLLSTCSVIWRRHKSDSHCCVSMSEKWFFFEGHQRQIKIRRLDIIHFFCEFPLTSFIAATEAQRALHYGSFQRGRLWLFIYRARLKIKYNYHTFNLTFSAVCWWVLFDGRAGEKTVNHLRYEIWPFIFGEPIYDHFSSRYY